MTLSATTPDWVTKDLLQETIEVWSPQYGYTLTEVEALAILTDMGNLLGHFIEG